MLPCMCHGHASASAGTWDTPGEPHSTMAKLCASPSCGGDLSLAYKVQRLHQKCIYSIEMCVCVKSCKWLYLSKEKGISLRKFSTSGVRLELLGSVC